MKFNISNNIYYDICNSAIKNEADIFNLNGAPQPFLRSIFEILQNMGMNKNTVLAWATFIMILMGLILIALGAFRYDDVAGWGFATVGIGFFAIAWVFNALKGRV